MKSDPMKVNYTNIILEIISWALLSSGIVSWYMEEGIPWIISIGLLFLAITIINSAHYPTFDYNHKPIVPCTNGNQGYWIANVLKWISLGLALTGLSIFLIYWDKWDALVKNILTRDISVHKDTAQNLECEECIPFIWYWIFFFVAAIVFMVKGFVLFTVLMQCGAISWNEQNKKEKNKIKLFREVVHDVLLGGIWLDLALRFEDLVNDGDDKAWRGLFSSMICIHLIYILSKVWDEPKYRINFKDQGMRCWYWKTIPLWFTIFKLTCYALLYLALIYRIHSDDMIISMGMKIEFLILSLVSISIIISLRIFQSTQFYKNLIESSYSVKNSDIVIDHSTSSGGRLKF